MAGNDTELKTALSFEMADTVALQTKKAAIYIGMNRRYLEDKRIKGGGPKYVRVSARCVLYRKADLDAWLEERIYSSTSEESAKNA